eukprot:CAMPEP_0197517872 /NCGR_PEP_ID=MMETSP1318-20131121/2938_1 /TAXON_ID=552666 /ORGANISM="Partenskyella glossopodia, Strain RCC365" /LENGTH=475 /DNA_ID=CAMNT_0043067781 /DNA_START=122 /DNA_END=1549 /DNA_ORIENTATION=+
MEGKHDETSPLSPPSQHEGASPSLETEAAQQPQENILNNNSADDECAVSIVPTPPTPGPEKLSENEESVFSEADDGEAEPLLPAKKLNSDDDIQQNNNNNSPLEAKEGEGGNKGFLPTSLAIGFYICCSAGMIIFNKYILFTLKFKRPLFLTISHMVFAILTTNVLMGFDSLAPRGPNRQGSLHWLIGEKPNISWKAIILRVFPVGLFFALNLWLSNLALLFIPISLTAMIKKGSIMLVVIFSWIVGLSVPSCSKLSAAVVVTFGVIIATYHEVNISVFGMSVQMLAVTFDVARLILINLLLRSADLKLNHFHSLRLFAPCCAMCLIPLLIAYEGFPSIPRLFAIGLPILGANLCLSFLVNISLLLVVQASSSTVLTLSGVGKDILLLWVSFFWFGSPIQAIQILGYVVSVFGILVYKNAFDLENMLIRTASSFGSRMGGDASSKIKDLEKEDTAFVPNPNPNPNPALKKKKIQP